MNKDCKIVKDLLPGYIDKITSEETNKFIEENLKEWEEIKFRPTKMYDETSYKIYKYIDIKDIEILITPMERLDDLGKKYKLSSKVTR